MRRLARWLGELRRGLREPGGTLALRAGAGVFVLLLLVYPYVRTVSGECRVMPGAVQRARATMAGRVEKVLVGEGQEVHKGDVLLRLSDRERQDDLQRAQAALYGAKAALERASARDLRGGRGRLEAAVTRWEREVERLQAQADAAIVRAGIDGKVVTPSPQELTNAVVLAGQELIEIDDTRRVIAEVLVQESDIAAVAVGQKVYARFYTDTGERYDSEVQTIMPVAERTLFGSVVVVKAPIANDQERLIPGTTGVAKIIGRRQIGIVMLARALALAFK